MFDEVFINIIDTFSDGILVVNTKGKIVLLNNTFLELWDIPSLLKNKISENQLLKFIKDSLKEPQKISANVDNLFKMNFNNNNVLSLRNENILRCASHYITKNGEIKYKVFLFKDITLENTFENTTLLLEQIYNNSLEGITITDPDGTILAVNPAFTTITGYTEDEALGENPRILKSDRHDAQFYTDMWDSLINKGYWQGEIWNRRKNGEAYPEILSITAIKDKNGTTKQYLAQFIDITEVKKNEQQIKFCAYYDALTELPNRHLFKVRLESRIKESLHNKKPFAVMSLDIDRFKVINETLGPVIGDILLQEVGKRLEKSISDVDTVARQGGDEFLFILTEIKDAKDAVKIAQEVLNKLEAPFKVEGHELHITASIGISIFPEDGETVDELIKNADTAMFRSKESKKNSYQLYRPHMNAKALKKLTLENDLRNALKNNELTLYYQPQFSLIQNEIVGMEALIRWEHPKHGVIPPSKFIPIAEEIGLIIPIGNWVLKTACEQNKKWQDSNLAKLPVSINIAAQQFALENIYEIIRDTLQETKLEPEYLEIEITESSIMNNPEKISSKLKKLKDLGIKIAIDDFGTGYSSLSYLKKFQIDYLKIDRSFVKDLTYNPEDEAIISAIIALGHSLNLKVIAEGVETSEQVRSLKRLGCDCIQGYILSRPLPSQKIIEKLSKIS